MTFRELFDSISAKTVYIEEWMPTNNNSPLYTHYSFGYKGNNATNVFLNGEGSGPSTVISANQPIAFCDDGEFVLAKDHNGCNVKLRFFVPTFHRFNKEPLQLPPIPTTEFNGA